MRVPAYRGQPSGGARDQDLAGGIGKGGKDALAGEEEEKFFHGAKCWLHPSLPGLWGIHAGVTKFFCGLSGSGLGWRLDGEEDAGR